MHKYALYKSIYTDTHTVQKNNVGVVKNSIYFDLPARDVFTLFVMLYFLY